MKTSFIRFDDVSEKSEELETLCSFFMNQQIAISLGVIPFQVTPECQKYLVWLKRKNKNLLEIDQHGSYHQKMSKGEFDVPESELREKLQKGKTEMKRLFGKHFSGILTVPWHAHSPELFRVAKELGFKAVSVNKRLDWQGQIFYHVASRLGLHSVFGHHIHSEQNTVLPEICPSIDFQKNYQNPAEFKTFHKVVREYLAAAKNDQAIGFLIHPQYIDEKSLQMIMRTFLLLKEKKIQFQTLAGIVESI